MPFVFFDDVAISYREEGQGETVLLLHGSFSTAETAFSLLLPELARSYHVLAPDMRGHGQTRSSSLYWNTPLLARDMLRFMSSKGCQQFHVIGHSMGGDVAMLMAHRAPERCLTLTSIGSGGMPSRELTTTIAGLMPKEEGDDLISRFARNQKTLHEAAHHGDWRTFFHMTIETCRRYPDFSEDDLKRLTMPFLLLYGSRDTLVSPEEVSRLARCCPHFTARTIEGARHAPQCSEKFLQEVARSLEAHLARYYKKPAVS